MGVVLRTTPAMRALVELLLEESDVVWGLRAAQVTGRPVGTIYPLLERLERFGLVESSWETSPERRGPARRLYHLTDAGRAWARARGLAARAKERTSDR